MRQLVEPDRGNSTTDQVSPLRPAGEAQAHEMSILSQAGGVSRGLAVEAASIRPA